MNRLPFVQPKQLGEMIRQQIRAALHAHNESTKAELAQLTGISFPSVGKAIDDMHALGEIALLGVGESSGGRKPQRYALNAGHMLGLAVYLEQSRSVCRLLDYAGGVVAEESLPGVLQAGPEALDALIASYMGRYPKIRALTFGVPAAVDSGKLSYIPTYDTFAGFDFKTAFESRYPVLALAENDMNVTALGYYDRLGLTNEQSIVYLYLGSNGPGAGIIVGGALVRGSSRFAGEVSLLPLYDDRNFGQSVEASVADRSSGRIQPPLIDAACRLIAVFAATINPDRFIFSDVDMNEGDLQAIRERSARYVPQAHVPILELGNWEADYKHGLNLLTTRSMLGIGSEA